jgi:hypothetical protein
MIKFFRKIRQQLLADRRISKYLLYATGEIVLVVIGILIALQVNNWNEHRKDQIAVRNMLANLLDEIIQDSASINEVYQFEKHVSLKAAEILYETHSNDAEISPDDSAVAKSFRYATFAPVLNFNKNSYEELSNSNLIGQLGSTTLKSALLAYYGHIDRLNKYAENTLHLREKLFDDLADHYTIKSVDRNQYEPLTEFGGGGEAKFDIDFDLGSFRSEKRLNPILYDMIDIHTDRLGILEIIMENNHIILDLIRDQIHR